MDECVFLAARHAYARYAQTEHGMIVNPITGLEVDVMQQCVNLHLDTTNDHDVGDLDAYKEVIADFVEHLAHGTPVWLELGNSQYQKGIVHRVNVEANNLLTYDFQYLEIINEGGKKQERAHILKDIPRIRLKVRPVLVRGDPAGGKTTFAKQLLIWTLQNEDWLVPVLIRTVDLVRSKDSFVEGDSGMVDQYLSLHYEQFDFKHLFALAKKSGRLLLILDGFDEAGTLEEQLSKEISQQLVNEAAVVLTSREMGSAFQSRHFERFRGVRVKELSENQQRQVIQRHLNNSEELMQQFSEQLLLNPALSQMAKNPLLLNVTLSVFESCCLSGNAGLNRGLVYSIALDSMLNSIEQSKQTATLLEVQISASVLRRLLRRIAFLAHTCDGGIRDFQRNLVQAAIESCGLQQTVTIEHWIGLEDVIKKGRLPVLTWFADGSNDVFRFAHLTFQEFLCAEECLQESLKDAHFFEAWRLLACPVNAKQLLERGWWQQVIQMYCDLVGSSQTLLRCGKCPSVALGEHFLRVSEDEDAAIQGQVRSVIFSTEMNDNNILTISSLLHGNQIIEQLSLGGAITSHGVSIFRCLNLSSLKILLLNHNEIGPEGCEAIATFLQVGNQCLECLELIDNIICQGALKADALPASNRNVRTGYYDSFETNLDGFSMLLNAIGKSRTLRSVDFRANFLNIEAGNFLAKTVLSNEMLETVCGIPVLELRQGDVRELDFSNSSCFIQSGRHCSQPFLSTGGLKLLVELLFAFPQHQLRVIRLKNQALPSDSVGVLQVYDELGKICSSTQSLELLDVSGFWDAGAEAGKALGAHLKDHTTLGRILVGTGKGWLNLNQLREIAQDGPDQVLDITDHPIRDCGAGILSQLLPTNVSRLEMKGTGVGACGYKALSQCSQLAAINDIQLKEFVPASTSLDLSKTPALSTGAVACVIARTYLTPNLKELNLSGSNLTSKSHVHPLTPVAGGNSGIGCNGGCDHPSFDGTNAYKHCIKCDLDFCATCCMSECPMVALAASLARLPSLIILKISDCAFEGGRDGGPVRSHLDIEGYKVLGEALAQSQIQELDISNNYFRGPGFAHLAKGVSRMKCLTTLKAGCGTIQFNNWLNSEEIQVEGNQAETLLLCMSIARNTNLKRLDLSNVTDKLGKAGVEALVESLSCPSATSLQPQLAERLEAIMLEPNYSLPFGSLCRGNIHDLDFSTEGIRDHEILAPLFILMLSFGTSLTTIDLRGVDFGSCNQMVSAAVLALLAHKLHTYNGQCLRSKSEIESLSVQNSAFMPHGISVLAGSVLQQVKGLKELDLSKCYMDALALKACLDALLKVQTLVRLDVSGQPLARTGISALGAFLHEDKCLQDLSARNISMPPTSGGEMLEFSVALETNTTLLKLDIRMNRVHPDIADRLRRTMEEKRGVVPLKLDVKLAFLLCNRRLPPSKQLPEAVAVPECSSLFMNENPICLIFRFAAERRYLLIDDLQFETSNSPHPFHDQWDAWQRHPAAHRAFDDSSSEDLSDMFSDEDM